MIFRSVLCALLTAWVVYADAGIESEHFEEDLVLRPLKDGRIGALFSFTTTLENTSPRNPESLGKDDECTCTRPRVKGTGGGGMLIVHSPALYTVPPHFGTDPSGIRNHRTASLAKRGEMGLRRVGHARRTGCGDRW